MSDDKPLSYKDKNWRKILTYFRNNDYQTSLEASLEYKYKHFKSQTQQSSLLNKKDKANVLNTIISSAYNLIKQNNSPEQTIWNLFFDNLHEYCRISSQAAQDEGLSGWHPDPAKNLFIYCLDLLCWFDPQNLKTEAKKRSNEFMAIKAESWGKDLVFSGLMQSIFEVRLDFERAEAMQNTKTLCKLYLDLSKDLKQEYKGGRTQVMNILADLDYFRGEEEKSLQWAKNCLQEAPEDQFANMRKKFLEERLAVQYQIRRFHHDSNTAFSGLNGILDRLKREPDAQNEPIKTYFQKMESNLRRLQGVHRFVQKRLPEPGKYDPLELLNKLKTDYAARMEISIHTLGEKIAWSFDYEYFFLALDNILKNSLEAFEQQKTAQNQRQVRIDLDYKQKMLIFEDNAGGIDPQIRNRIFEPFVSTKGVKQETGLGLYHARQAIEKNRGRLELTSEQPENGTRFEINMGKIR